MDPINLGKRCSSPGCEPIVANPVGYGSDISFPRVYLDDLPEDADLPLSGLITFRYTLCRTTLNHEDEDVDQSIELLQLVEVKGAPEIKAKGGADALDKYAAEKSGDKTDSDEEAPDREDYVAPESA